MAESIRSELRLDTAAWEARLKSVDQRAARQDERIKRNRTQLADIESRAAQFSKRMTSLSRQAVTSGIRTATALGAEEAFDALGIRESAFGRISSQALQGLAVGGPWGAFGAVVTSGISELARAMRDSRKEIDQLKKANMELRNRFDIQRKEGEKRIAELRKEMLEKLEEEKAAIREEADETFYQAALAAGGRAA